MKEEWLWALEVELIGGGYSQYMMRSLSLGIPFQPFVGMCVYCEPEPAKFTVQQVEVIPDRMLIILKCEPVQAQGPDGLGDDIMAFQESGWVCSADMDQLMTGDNRGTL